MISLMSSERTFGRRFFLKATILVGGGALIVPPLLNIENTLRVINAVVGKDVECASQEVQEGEYLFDAIVVPGAGNIKTADGNHLPSNFGNLRLEAAAIAYFRKIAPAIILLGKEEGSLANETSRKALDSYYRKLAGEEAFIPDWAILSEENSINTATNMSELAKITVAREIGNVQIVTNTSHTARSALFACANGVFASAVSAEKLIVSQYPERAEEIAEMYDSWELKEALEVVFAAWDPKGTGPTLLRRIMG